MSIALRRWWLAALCVVVGAAAAGIVSSRQQQQYQASAQLLFRNDTAPDQSLQSVIGLPPSGATASDPSRQAATNVALVSLDTVDHMTAQALGQRVTASDVKSEISVQSVGQSDVVAITATDPSPARASTLANTFARQFIVFRQNTDRSLVNSAIHDVESQIRSLAPPVRSGSGGRHLRNQLLQLQSLAQIQNGNAELVQSATVPTSPSTPRTKMNVVAGGLLGLILGIVLAIVFYRVDRRVRTPEELAEAYDLPLLGVVPRVKALVRRRRRDETLPAVPPVPMEEAFRAIRARLRYFNVDRELQSVLVTSAAPGEGKSTVAWQLARAIAMTGNGKVLLLETDLRRPELARRHGLRAYPGLAELLFHREALSSIVQSVTVAELVGAEASAESPVDDGPVGPAGAFPLEGEAVCPVDDEFEDRGNGVSGTSGLELAGFAKIERGRDAPGTTQVGSMDVIVAGDIPPNPSELLESDAMSKLLRRLAEHYDFVILDASPGSLVSDTLPLASQVSGVIVVSSMRHQSPDQVERLRNQLEKVGATMVGVVVNQAKIRREDPYSGYRRMPTTSSVAGEGTSAAGVGRDVDAAVDDAPSEDDEVTADVSHNGAADSASARA